MVGPLISHCTRLLQLKYNFVAEAMTLSIFRLERFRSQMIWIFLPFFFKVKISSPPLELSLFRQIFQQVLIDPMSSIWPLVSMYVLEK